MKLGKQSRKQGAGSGERADMRTDTRKGKRTDTRKGVRTDSHSEHAEPPSNLHSGCARLDRNNTNFSLRLLEYFRNSPIESKYSFLKYYQNVARLFVTSVDVDSRGLLFAVGTGLGKSILAISIAMDLIDERPPIILLAKSLQENMRESVHKYIALRRGAEPDYHMGLLSRSQIDEYIDGRFNFVSMNASNMFTQMTRATSVCGDEFDAALESKFGEMLKVPSLDGKLLIVDEAHNFFRAITNGSKNAISLYELIIRARNLRVLFFTGTPIASHPFELVPCFNMIGSRVPGRRLFPETYGEFCKLYVDEKTGMIKNRGKFQNRIFGLVSRVTNKSRPGAALGRSDTIHFNLPEQLPLIVERIHMAPAQYVSYLLARDKEREESSSSRGRGGEAGPLVKPKGSPSSSYRVHSRQLSNWAAPTALAGERDPARIPDELLESPKFRQIMETVDSCPRQLGLVYSQFVGVGGLGTFARYLDSRGWRQVKPHSDKQGGDEYKSYPVSADEYIASIDSASEDAAAWWLGGESLSQPPDTGTADSSTSLLDIIEDSEHPASASSQPEPKKTRTYAVIAGAIDHETRTWLQSLFNSEENSHGEIIDLLLISSAGAEGLDLKNIRHIHILEPYWGHIRIVQVLARGVRNDSHIALPPEERNVTARVYLAIPPESERLPDGTYPLTTDVELYTDAVFDYQGNESFIDAISEVSIECLVNGEENCRVCSPNNRQLYTDDPARDALGLDPCTTTTSAKVSVSKIIVDGAEYFYSADASNIYDYKVYELDSQINSYRQIMESDTRLHDIVAAIADAEGKK